MCTTCMPYPSVIIVIQTRKRSYTSVDMKASPMYWAHEPVPAGPPCLPVLVCPGLVHDARIALQWLLPEATPASQTTLHCTTSCANR